MSAKLTTETYYLSIMSKTVVEEVWNIATVVDLDYLFIIAQNHLAED